MAKLESVKILDMINGEPTRVEYNGTVYEKTEDGAKAGDLVRVVDKDGIGYVTQGGFYEIYIDDDDDLVFGDDDGDERVYCLNDDALETFRKVNETKANADLVERLAELERRLEVLEERTATKDESAPKFEVGDYAKVIEPGYCGDIKVGSIVRITKPKDDDGHYRVELLDGSDYDYFADGQLEKVTEEEFAQIRWAKIGRKPGEFKKGDIIRVKRSNAGLPIGTIGEIIGIDNDGDLDVSNGVNSRYHGTYQVELIVPVEQRFDLAVEPKAGVHQ
jgi:hypothetical protein